MNLLVQASALSSKQGEIWRKGLMRETPTLRARRHVSAFINFKLINSHAFNFQLSVSWNLSFILIAEALILVWMYFSQGVVENLQTAGRILSKHCRGKAVNDQVQLVWGLPKRLFIRFWKGFFKAAIAASGWTLEREGTNFTEKRVKIEINPEEKLDLGLENAARGQHF